MFSSSFVSKESKGPKVAVIVPIYNVGAYLCECLESILGQTYDNFILFAVNDGSTDNSGQIINEFASRDSRVIPIHQKNQGQGAARNNALQRIESIGAFDYIAFVDGDDKVQSNFLANFVATAKRTGADITVCAFQYQDRNRLYQRGRLEDEMFLGNEEYFEFVLSAGSRSKYRGIVGTGGMVWNKFFSARVLHSLRFPTNKNLVEDELFCIQVGKRSRKNFYFPSCLYIYRQHPGSDVKQNSIYKKMLLARFQTLALAFSPRTKLIATAGLIVASLDYFKRYESYPPLNLEQYKEDAIKASAEGHLSKQALRRFLLLCNYPALFRIFLVFRRMSYAIQFWKHHR